MSLDAGRVAWLLAHPLQFGGEDLAPYRSVTRQPDGALLVAVLAVDR